MQRVASADPPHESGRRWQPTAADGAAQTVLFLTEAQAQTAETVKAAGQAADILLQYLRRRANLSFGAIWRQSPWITTDVTDAMAADPYSQMRGPRNRLDVYLSVISALMLRDMRSRFAGNYWGYLVQVFWPCVHLGIIVGAMHFRGAKSPMGNDTMLFVATGALPALAFQYVSREVMKGYLTHKPLTYFPQVKRLDTVVARCLVEIVSSFMGLMVIMFVLACFGVDPIPTDMFTAITGYLAAVGLGIGVGMINVGIVSVFPAWVMGYILVTLSVYLTAGVYFLACYMPAEIYYYMKWNPVTQLIEWVRLGYEPSLPQEVDYMYVYGWIFSSLTIGLLMERYIVRAQQ